MTVYMYSLSQRIYVDKRYDTCHHTKIIIIMLVLQVIFWRGNSKNSYDHDKNGLNLKVVCMYAKLHTCGNVCMVTQ